MNQIEAIVDYMKHTGPITSRGAMLNLGVGRLASRIGEMKELGYDVRDKMVYQRDKDGKLVKKWKEYWLA